MLSILLENTVHVDVVCAACGMELISDSIDCKLYNSRLEITPCLACINNAVEETRNEPYEP